MSAFEFKREDERVLGTVESVDSRADRLRQECIIALKVYDSCRQQFCLNPDELGPARAAESVCIDGHHIEEGDIIIPPASAVSVSIERLRTKKIIVVNKEENEFRPGFWDIDLKYVFEYRLVFRETDAVIGAVKAINVFTKRVSLFGSTGSDLVIATDLFCSRSESNTIEAEPFVMVEAKAVPLEAEIYSRRHRGDRAENNGTREIFITLGLFTIIKIYRIVDLLVESRGFNIPKECEEVSPLNPCEFFDNLDFPMDIFAPPIRSEFTAGISGDIPRKKDDRDGCGC